MNIITISFFINLFFSVINIFLYALAYFRVSRAKVDGKFKLTKFVLLLEFITVLVFAILQTVIYSTVIFHPNGTRDALYLENFAILLFNIGFTMNAILLAYIVEKK